MQVHEVRARIRLQAVLSVDPQLPVYETDCSGGLGKSGLPLALAMALQLEYPLKIESKPSH